jgi:hypothetical protein
MIKIGRCASADTISVNLERRKMVALDPTFQFKKRHKLSPVTHILDIADFKVGWIFTVPFVKILKIKTSKIMQKDKYLTIIKIFNREYVKV